MVIQVEAELQELEEGEAQEYLEGLGVQEGGLRSLIAATYKQLGLLTYFTTGQPQATWCRQFICSKHETPVCFAFVKEC